MKRCFLGKCNVDRLVKTVACVADSRNPYGCLVTSPAAATQAIKTAAVVKFSSLKEKYYHFGQNIFLGSG